MEAALIVIRIIASAAIIFFAKEDWGVKVLVSALIVILQLVAFWDGLNA